MIVKTQESAPGIDSDVIEMCQVGEFMVRGQSHIDARLERLEHNGGWLKTGLTTTNERLTSLGDRMTRLDGRMTGLDGRPLTRRDEMS